MKCHRCGSVMVYEGFHGPGEQLTPRNLKEILWKDLLHDPKSLLWPF
jgi:hypothetical protein